MKSFQGKDKQVTRGKKRAKDDVVLPGDSGDIYIKRYVFIIVGVVTVLGGLALAVFKGEISKWILGK